MADTKSTATKSKGNKVFTDEERAAMVDRARELKAEARRGRSADKAAEAEQEVVDKLAELPDPDRTLGQRIHDLVKANAPVLAPKLWYGMPAYAKDGKVVCYFTPASKFNSRYATFGFNEDANLDDGDFWATSFAVQELTPDAEARITELVKKSVS